MNAGLRRGREFSPGLRRSGCIVRCQPPRAASTLNLPPPTAAIYRNRKQYSTAGVAAVADSPEEESAGRMRKPIGKAHQSRAEEGHRAREQADQQQYSAKNFNRAGYAASGKQFERSVGFYREAEHLLRSVLQEHERRDDSGDAENLAGIFFELGLNCIDHGSSLSGLSPVFQILTSWQGPLPKILARPATGTIYTLKRLGSNRVSRLRRRLVPPVSRRFNSRYGTGPRIRAMLPPAAV